MAIYYTVLRGIDALYVTDAHDLPDAHDLDSAIAAADEIFGETYYPSDPALDEHDVCVFVEEGDVLKLLARRATYDTLWSQV